VFTSNIDPEVDGRDVLQNSSRFIRLTTMIKKVLLFLSPTAALVPLWI
jgi:hypothetical protein